MKAFLILEDGHIFTGTSIGSRKEVISENHGVGVSFRERNELWESSFSKVFEILWVFGEKYEERAQLISFP